LGRERIRAREYLYFLVACIIFLSPAGCTTLKEIGARRTADHYLAAAERLLEQGDYEGAIKEDQKALSLSPTAPPGDQAMFHEGLVYAHYGYRRKDNQKSIDCFRRLTKVFPESPLAGQARIWIGILQENERVKRDNQELARAIRKSKQVDIEVDEKKREFSR
jgi:outer membrane protein assembly factor BamD (BamD/ComL family)